MRAPTQKAVSRNRRPLLLAGASLAALLVGSNAAIAADILRGTVTAAPITASQASQAAAQQAALAAQRAQETLTRTTQALQAMQSAQSAAHALAVSAASTVPNGLAAGGLQVVSNPVSAAQDTTGLNTWQGAAAPSQSTDGSGHVNVNIKQTDSRAILSWQSYNVGKDTTLTYDQQGNADWIALNRVVGASASPSQILGNIKADGTVLIINQNGIIFGGSSQINVNSLIATSLDVGRVTDHTVSPATARSIAQRNQEFLADGLLGFADSNSSEGAVQTEPTFSPTDATIPVTGKILVENGAQLAAGDSGYILLAGPVVENGGHLSASDGQVILVGADSVALETATGASGSVAPELRGFVPVVQNTQGGVESAINDTTGLIESPRGSILIAATDAASNQGGLFSSTSVSRNGAIEIYSANIEIAPGAIIAITPDSNDETIPQDPSSLSDFKSSVVTIGNSGNYLAGNLSSGDIDIGANALVYAPSGNISIGAQQGASAIASASAVSRLFVDSGATIDASGLKDVVIPASRNQIEISPLKNNELADDPAYKDSFLNGATVYVDPRLSGVRDDGVAWIGSPLIDAASYYQQVGVSVSELMTKGGNVVLGTDSYAGTGPATNAPNVVVKAGATIDISGGWVTYQQGMVQTTQLLTSSGQIVDIGNANLDDTYVGIYTGYTVGHSRWGITETYGDIFSSNEHYAQSYTEGRDAGSLTVKTSAVALDATIYAQAFPGLRQTEDAKPGTATSTVYGDTRNLQAAPSQLPTGGLLFIQAQTTDTVNGDLHGGADIRIENASNYQPLPQDISYGQTLQIAADGTVSLPVRDPASYLTADDLSTINLSDAMLSQSGWGEVSLATTGAVTVDADAHVDLEAGGSFHVLAGRRIAVEGAVSAPSGDISLATFDSRSASAGGSVFSSVAPQVGDFDIVVDGTLSARGRWVNDLGLDDASASGSAWLDGGSITLYAAPRISSVMKEQVAPADAPANVTATDLSGSILINAGSTLDVSGGGRVDRFGHLDLTAKGGNVSLYDETTYFQIADMALGLGAAGTLSGFRVDGLQYPTSVGPLAYVPVNPDRINSHVSIDPDSIRAQGFGGGGTFTLTTPSVALGEGTAATTTYLPLDFFSNTGFANYKITSYGTDLIANPFNNNLGGTDAILSTQTLTVGAGQILNLSQSLLPDVLNAAQAASLRGLPTGGDLFSLVSPEIPGDAWDRKPVNLTLAGLLELNVAQGGAIVGEAGASLTVDKLLNQGSIRLPGGTITQQEVLPSLYTVPGALGVHALSDAFSVNPDGTIDEGTLSHVTGLTNAQLAGTVSSSNTPNPIYLLGMLDADQGIVLAPGSVTDLSGTSIRNPYATGPNGAPITTGRMVDGGSIVAMPLAALPGQQLFQPSIFSDYAILAGDTTPVNQVTVTALDVVSAGRTITAAPGALIDLSGASDIYEQPVAGSSMAVTVNDYAATPVWSDAGTLSAQGGATLTGATILARGGAPDAEGGTLVLLDPVFAQHDPQAPAGNVISSDMIGAAGFETLVALGSASAGEDVTIDLGRAFFLEDRPFANNGTLADDTSPNVLVPTVRSGGGTLTINAPYISFSSAFDAISSPAAGAAGAGAVVFNAGTIDFSGVLLIDRSVASATFNATGDIRLSGVQPWRNTYVPNSAVSPALNGQIAANGNLTFNAAQLYPTTGSSFVITSASPDGVIQFGRSGGETPDAPYSAGGNLLVQAATIMQGGILRVPVGELTLGGSSAYVVSGSVFAPASQSVELAQGSITSVSANGLDIPYGTTTDQTEWYFSLVDANPLTAPPQKLLTLNGGNISIDQGANVDLAGGGDIYAYEFIPGTGGSRDVLDQLNPDTFTGNNGYQYPDHRQVYAIVPGLSNAPVAARDPIYSAGYDLASAQGAGTRVYLTGSNGLSAGWYTLLPAKYALLPGGMRVVEETGANNVVAGTSRQARDGSLLVAGYYGDTLSGAAQSQVRLFNVQSQAVFKAESNIAETTGSSYFSALAAHSGSAVPQLPIDAGRLVLNPGSALVVDTVLSTAAGSGGRGAQVDIGGSSIDILSSLPAVDPQDGVVRVTASSLTNLNAESLLVGGTRTDNDDGSTRLNVTADTVVVQNGSADPLSAAEVLLAANSSVTVADGAAIVANGTLSDTRTGAYDIGTANLPGTGALLRVANGPERLVARTNAATTASLDVGKALLSGDAVVFDSSGSNLLDGGLIIQNAKYVALGAPRIGFGADPANFDGLVLTGGLEQLLTQSGAQLTLRSQSSIDFAGGTYDFGSVRFDTAALSSLDGGDVTIHADTVGLGNVGAAGTVCTLCAPGNGTLAIDAGTIVFTGGSVATKASVLTAPVAATLATDVTVYLPVGTSVSGITVTVPTAMILPAAKALSLGLGTGVVQPAGADGTIASGTTITSSNLSLALPADGTTYYFPNGIGALSAQYAPLQSPITVTLPVGTQVVLGADVPVAQSQFFGSGVSLSASQGIFAQGQGGLLDTGTAALALHTPYLGDKALPLAAGATAILPSLTLASTGAVTIDNANAAATGSVAGIPGSAVTINGGSVQVSGTTIHATAGAVTVNAADGITLSDGAVLEAPGYTQSFSDSADPVYQSAPGGHVTLNAQGADIALGDARLSVGGGSGDAGTLSLNAPNGTIDFGNATLDGTGGSGGAGGSFALESLGAVDLVQLSDKVSSNGFTGSFSVHTHAGDLVLNADETLKSSNVSLVADGGAVSIAGTIDTSGTNGGDVALYGRSGVSLADTARIDASAAGYAADDTRQAKGGDVTLGTDFTATTTNADGSISGSSGAISVAGGAVIDVSAKRPGDRLVPYYANGTEYYNFVQGDLGGTVTLRAPLVGPAGANTVDVAVDDAGSIVGAREIDLVGFRRWDLAAVANSGLYTGVTRNGSAITLDVSAGLDTANADGTQTTVAGINFLGDKGQGGVSTLVDFIQGFDVSASYGNLGGLASQSNFHARPGVDLANSGGITLASNWNLAAGLVNVTAAQATHLMGSETFNGASGSVTMPYILPGDDAAVFAGYTTMLYRTDHGSVSGEAPVVSLLAGGDLAVNASLNDGFFQFRDQTNPDYLAAIVAHSTTTILFQVGVDTFAGGPGLVSSSGVGHPISASSAPPNPFYIPYVAGGNSAAPAMTGDPFGSATLFPLLPDNAVADSSSLSLVAGSALSLQNSALSASVDPLSVSPGSLAGFSANGHYTYSYGGTGVSGVRYDNDFSSNVTTALTVANTSASATWLADVISKNKTSANYTPAATYYYGTDNRSTPAGSPLIPSTAGAKTFNSQSNLLYLDFSFAPTTNVTGTTIKPNATLNAVTLRTIALISDPSNPQYDAYLHGLYTSNASTPTAQGDFFTIASKSSSFLPATTTSFNNLFLIVSLKTAAYILQKYIDPLFDGQITNVSTVTVKSLIRTGVGSINIAAPGNVDLRGGSTPSYVKLDGSPAADGSGSNQQLGGAAIYTAGHPAIGSVDTAVDPATGASITVDLSQTQPGGTNIPSSATYAYGNSLAGGSAAANGVVGALIADPVRAEGGGDITVTAGGDVLSRRDGVVAKNVSLSSGSTYGWIGASDEPWRTGNVGSNTSAAIDPQLFAEGLGTLGGGDITVDAGGDISDLSVIATDSMVTANATGPASPTKAIAVFGGGNVSLSAGADIAGGRVDVASGQGNIVAGGSVTSAGRFSTPSTLIDNLLRLRISDATVDITASGDVTLQGVAALGVLQRNNDVAGQQYDMNAMGLYSAHAGLNVVADGTVTVPGGDDSLLATSPTGPKNAVFPGTFTAAALTGNIDLLGNNGSAAALLLAPSPVGQLQLLAGGDIAPATVAMLDADPGQLPGPFSTFLLTQSSSVASGVAWVFPLLLPDLTQAQRALDHNQQATHAGDPMPVRIDADGDIGNKDGGLILSVPKQARITAGQDIINMMFFGQNLGPSDVTRITAGRDITGTSKLISTLDNLPALQGNTFLIGGPGSFMLEAGRDIGPFLNSAVVTSVSGNVAVSRTYGGGVLAVGNDWNPWLPQQSADISVMFGVAGGAEYDALRDTYLNPANIDTMPDYLFAQQSEMVAGPTGVEIQETVADRSKPIYGPLLVQWMQAHAPSALLAAFGTTDVSYDQAYVAFAALPSLNQRAFLNEVYFDELKATDDPQSPSYHQYGRGYQAVNTLFPASDGYTQNDLTGGSNGANATVETGNLDLRLATIQTEWGGNITILGPGGEVLGGSLVRTTEQAARRVYDGERLFAGNDSGAGTLYRAIPVAINAIPSADEGVLTLRGGSISSFTDGDFLLNQSRLFTEGGGDIVMWSSNADINAGQGPKTSANFPPVVVRVSPDLYSQLDQAGATTGAGIAALQATADSPPSNVYLMAPRGTVDLGDAGVRVSGDFYVAALRVANADNAQVGGHSFGLPTVVAVDTAALSAASNVAAAGAQTAMTPVTQNANTDLPSIITVEVLGYGGDDSGR